MRLLMAAAVADFRPQTRAEQKIKKKEDSDEAPTIILSRTPDILLSVKERRAATTVLMSSLGFAAESEHLITHARAKLERKGLDLLIANDITAPDAGFEVDTNRVIILGADGSQTPLALASKTHIAEAIV